MYKFYQEDVISSYNKDIILKTSSILSIYHGDDNIDYIDLSKASKIN